MRERLMAVFNTSCENPKFEKAEELIECAKPTDENVVKMFEKCGRKKNPKKMYERVCIEIKNPKTGSNEKHKMPECLKDPENQKIIQKFRDEMKEKKTQEKIVTCMEGIVPPKKS